MYEGPEKRQYKRIEQHFILRFRVQPAEAAGAGRRENDVPEGWNMVTSQDFGAGGALFNFDKKIDIGTRLEFQINFPKIEEPIICMGKVIRIEQSEYAPIFRIAVRFLDMPDEDKDIIEKAADEFYHRKYDRQ